MLNSIPFSIIVGTVLGFLAGLGVGGGSLLILWLTLVLGMAQNDARILNLLFFLPSALIATIFRKKQGSLNLKKIFPAIITGCVFAGIFSILAKNADLAFLKKAFGILLLFTGIREILYLPRKVR